MPRWVSASATAQADLSTTSPTVRALGHTPVGTGMTVTTQAAGTLLTNATSTVTGTLMTPLWKASTIYPAGAAVLHPTDLATVLVRTAAGTSRATYDATEQALWTAGPSGTQVNYPARYNLTFCRQKYANAFDTTGAVYGPRAPHLTNGTEESNNSGMQPGQWSMDFDWYTAAGALEVPIFNDCQIRFIIDGQYASATPAGVVADSNFRYIKLSGVAAGFHRVRLELGGGASFIGGVKLATGDVMFPPSLPGTKSIAIVADSYVDGYTGVGAAMQFDVRGYGSHLARLLGMTNYLGLSRSSTGFTVSTTSLFAPRITDLTALQPDYVLIVGTSNDYANRATTLPGSALTFYQQAKAACPNSNIVAVGAMNFDNGGTRSDEITAILKVQAATAGVPFLDTTSWGIVPAAFIGSDNAHPTVPGHEYLARRLAKSLAAMWKLPI